MNSETYPAPARWHDVAKIAVQMRRDLLSRHARQGGGRRTARDKLGMDPRHYSNQCAELGVCPKTGDLL